MDLWIRSQDKEMLCRAKHIELMHDDPVYAKIFLNGNFPDLIVGCYEKKRALEILDEIQRLLMGQNNMLIKTDCCDITLKDLKLIKESIEKNHWVGTTENIKIEYISPTTIVYEMPEK